MRQYRPSSPRGVVVDSSAYFAAFDRDDVFHTAAQTILTRLAKRHVRLLTTSFILAEVHALLLNRLNRQLASQFLRDTLQGSTALIWIAPVDVQRATEILDQYDDKEFSLTDATCFAAMERLGITHAFSFDDHFKQYGLTILTPDNC